MAVLLLAAMVGLLPNADAHGGGLHAWLFTPTPTPGKDFFRHRIATCSSWAPLALNLDNAATLPGVLPVFPSATNSTLNVTGQLHVWWYLNSNCSDDASTSLEVANISFSLNGAPYAGKQMYGYGFTGNCSSPGDLYRQNATAGDDRFNLQFFRRENAVTGADGVMWGMAVNRMTTRTPGQPLPLMSVVLLPNPNDSPPMCCNLQYLDPPASGFFQQGSLCRTPSPPPPRPPAPPSPPASPSPPSPPMKRPPPHDKGKKRPPPRKHLG